ncbi:MAG TPA: FecR family protein, partial [Armatimonadota bacterium]|nr:FecR family protein [Armatimonadota bacterium]
ASAIALLAATATQWRSAMAPSAVATVVAAQGVGQVLRASGAEAAVPGARIEVGDTIATQPGGSVCLCFPDRSCVTVQGGTMVRIVELPPTRSPARLDLERGLITGRVQHGREMLVRTPCATASAEGTRFCLNATDEQSCLTVREGRVGLANDHGQVHATAMQHASATRTAAPEAPVSAPIPDSGGHCSRSF